jgi:hypothetical protein
MYVVDLRVGSWYPKITKFPDWQTSVPTAGFVTSLPGRASRLHHKPRGGDPGPPLQRHPSPRLAIRAPRCGISATYHAVGTLDPGAWPGS